MKYLTKYSDENLWKEDWKKEYKYGVILFVPPEPIRSLVDKLKQEYDPFSFKTCVAHISLTMPIEHPLTKEHLSELQNNLKNFKSFIVTYGPLINFLPKAPGIVFKIKQQDQFKNLYKKIESTKDFKFYKRKWPFKAHLTIAEFLDDETTKNLTEKLNKTLDPKFLFGSFICDKVSYMVPDQDFCFQEVATIDLARS